MRSQLEQAIVDDPDNADGYSVYADWLMEQNDPRGELIELQLRLESEGLGGKERRRLDRQQRRLIDLHSSTWLGALAKPLLAEPSAGAQYEFARGFLHTVKLHDVRFIEDAAFAHLATCFALRELDLSYTNVSDEILAGLVGLRVLKILSLEKTAVGKVGLGHVARLASLAALSLRSTKVRNADLEALGEATTLRSLDIGWTKVTKVGLRHLTTLKQLTELSLTNVRITDKAVADVVQLEALERLSLSRTGITDNGLVPLTELQTLTDLDLTGTQVTDDGMAQLAKIKTLKTVHAGETGVTQYGYQLLKQALPKCYITVR